MFKLGQYSSWGTKLPQVIDIESSKSISKLGQLNLPQFGIGANPKLGHNNKFYAVSDLGILFNDERLIFLDNTDR